ncbi:MAG: metallophosphoesterase [Eubacterium sp.]|nr:metallophosphoesterase [Eubacterium sp.]
MRTISITRKRLLIMAIMAAVVMIMFGAQPKKTQAATILSSKSVKVETSKTLKVKFKSKLSEVPTVTSTNSKVVKVKKVSKKAIKIKGVSKGTAYIKITYKNKTYKCKVTVKKPTLKASSKTSVGFVSTAVMKNALSDSATWSSSNTKVLSVKKKSNATKAKIKAKKAGKAKITVKYNGKTYTKKISVTKASMNVDSASIAPTRTKNLTVENLPSGVTSKVCSWSKISSKKSTKYVYYAVSDKSIAKLTAKSNGKVQVKGYCTGTVTVKANFNGVICTTKIKVKIPSYWKSEISTSKKAVKSIRTTSSSLSEFIYLTDSHWYGNAGQSPAIVNKLSSDLDIDFAVHGGDVIYKHESSSSSAIAEIKEFVSLFDSSLNLMHVVGNHDDNSTFNDDASSYLSNSTIRSLLMSPQASFATVKSSSFDSYYDDTTQKVRYINFYYDHSTKAAYTDITWVDERVSELSSDWSVVLLSHAYYGTADKGESVGVQSEAKALGNHFLELDQNTDANIILWMVGHSHRDLDTVLSNDTDEIQVVCTNTDCFDRSEIHGGLAMTEKTITEQVIDVVQIDTTNRMIYYTRVGAGVDRSFSYSE